MAQDVAAEAAFNGAVGEEDEEVLEEAGVLEEDMVLEEARVLEEAGVLEEDMVLEEAEDQDKLPTRTTGKWTTTDDGEELEGNGLHGNDDGALPY